METSKIVIYDQVYVDMYDRFVNALSNNDTLYDPANQHWLLDNARMIAELRNVLMDYISYCFESISRIPFSKSNQELFANYAISKAFEHMNCNAPEALEKDIMAITAMDTFDPDKVSAEFSLGHAIAYLYTHAGDALDINGQELILIGSDRISSIKFYYDFKHTDSFDALKCWDKFVELINKYYGNTVLFTHLESHITKYLNITTPPLCKSIARAHFYDYYVMTRMRVWRLVMHLFRDKKYNKEAQLIKDVASEKLHPQDLTSEDLDNLTDIIYCTAEEKLHAKPNSIRYII